MSDLSHDAGAEPLPRIAQRPVDAHKGDFGRALLIGGSRGMAGAVALAGMATLRAGAGLVRLAVPDICLDAVAGLEPSYMTAPLPSDGEGRIGAASRASLEAMIGSSNCVACGPGLGRSSDLTELVQWLFQAVTIPLVLDADALNALAERPDVLADASGPRVLTPHLGEFRRLIGDTMSRLSMDQLRERAIRLAGEHGLIIVLKGHRTLVTDGTRSSVNATGNPGMATGGSGDVLTGVITGLVCQGLSDWDAARLGVHLHGLAGDLAAEQLGQISLVARDLVDLLPPAFRAAGY
jgi:NAD(P)H-hydrate epimerase